jgi:hypothetical protein
MRDADEISDEELDELGKGALAVQESMIRQLRMTLFLFGFVGLAAASYYPTFRERACLSKPEMCREPPSEPITAGDR